MPKLVTALTIAAASAVVAAAPAGAQEQPPAGESPAACATGNAPPYACEAYLRTLAGASPLSVPAQAVVVRRDRATLEVRCYAAPAGTCNGFVDLRTLLPGPSLGRARVDLGAGERARVRVMLRRGARAIAEAAAAGASGAVVVARFRADGVPAITAGAVQLR